MHLETANILFIQDINTGGVLNSAMQAPGNNRTLPERQVVHTPEKTYLVAGEA